MKKYVSVLNDVVCLDEIKRIRILYHNGTNYSNNWMHTLFITFKDGTEIKYSTDNYPQASHDYEALKSALLEISDDHPIEKNGEDNE